MTGLLSLTTILIVASAILFYRAAQFEGRSGLLWTVLSVAISLILLEWFHWGLIGIILGQVGLFFGIAIARTIRKS